MRFIYCPDISSDFKVEFDAIYFTGPLYLARDPVEDNEAATKGYTDKVFSNLTINDFKVGYITDNLIPAFTGDLRNKQGSREMRLIKITDVKRTYNPLIDIKGRALDGDKWIDLSTVPFYRISFKSITYDNYVSLGDPRNEGLSIKDFVKKDDGGSNLLRKYDYNTITGELVLNYAPRDPDSCVTELWVWSTFLNPFATSSRMARNQDENIVIKTAPFNTGIVVQSPEGPRISGVLMNGALLKKSVFKYLYDYMGDFYDTQRQQTTQGKPWVNQSNFATASNTNIVNDAVLYNKTSQERVLEEDVNTLILKDNLIFLNTETTKGGYNKSFSYKINKDGTLNGKKTITNNILKQMPIVGGRTTQYDYFVYDNRLYLINNTLFSDKDTEVCVSVGFNSEGEFDQKWRTENKPTRPTKDKATIVQMGNIVYMFFNEEGNVEYTVIRNDGTLSEWKVFPYIKSIQSVKGGNNSFTTFMHSDKIYFVSFGESNTTGLDVSCSSVVDNVIVGDFTSNKISGVNESYKLIKPVVLKDECYLFCVRDVDKVLYKHSVIDLFKLDLNDTTKEAVKISSSILEQEQIHISDLSLALGENHIYLSIPQGTWIMDVTGGKNNYIDEQVKDYKPLNRLDDDYFRLPNLLK